jgi:tetratricopeptide (TPR) repeat protein
VDHTEHAYRFVLATQPERRIALSVLREALDCLRRGKRRYPSPVGLPSLRDLRKRFKRYVNAGIHASRENGRRLYFAVHVVCERWERFQRSGESDGDPIYAYTPSDADYVFRYHREQIFRALNSKFAGNLAVGQGCFTFQYARADIPKIFPDWIDGENVRRQAKEVFEHLNERFSGIIMPEPRAQGVDPYDFVRDALRSPDEDRTLFIAFTSVAAPWSVDTYPSDDAAYLAFAAGGLPHSRRAGWRWGDDEWRRLRALVERFPGLVRSYNSTVQPTLKDPDEMLRFPKIQNARRDPDPHARFHEPPLTDSERQWLGKGPSAGQGRGPLQAQHLVVYVNGDRKAVLGVPGDSARIRADAGHGLLQVFAVEGREETLVAAVPLDELDVNTVGRKYRVRIRVGRSLRLLLLMTMAAGEREAERELVIEATVSPRPTLVDVAQGLMKPAFAVLAIVLLASVGYQGSRLQQQTRELDEATRTIREQATELARRQWRDDMERIVTARLQTVARTQADVQLESLHAVLDARLRGGSFESLMTLGNAFLYGGDLNAAARVFERAKAVRGSEIEPYNVLGAIMHLQGRPHEAVAQLRRATELWPLSSRVHVYLAWYLEAIGDRSGARAALQKALALQNDYADAHYNVGLLEQRDGRESEAARHFDAVQRLLERDLAARPEDGELHFQMAKLLATRGRNTDAAAHLEKAVTVDPDWAFWGRHETAFVDLFGQRPDLRQVLDELSMVPVIERIRAAVEGLA